MGGARTVRGERGEKGGRGVGGGGWKEVEGKNFCYDKEPLIIFAIETGG